MVLFYLAVSNILLFCSFWLTCIIISRNIYYRLLIENRSESNKHVFNKSGQVQQYAAFAKQTIPIRPNLPFKRGLNAKLMKSGIQS